jgi:hypothetical protein
MGGFVLISDAEIQGCIEYASPPTSGKCIQTWPRSAPWFCKISTKLKKDVRGFVEKYFFDTPERPKSLDISTFLEGVGVSCQRR